MLIILRPINAIYRRIINYILTERERKINNLELKTKVLNCWVRESHWVKLAWNEVIKHLKSVFNNKKFTLFKDTNLVLLAILNIAIYRANLDLLKCHALDANP